MRSRSNVNLYKSNIDNLELDINKIHWKIQHVQLSDSAKLNMLKMISRNESLYLPFRTWDLYELPLTPQTTRHTWSVKTTSQVNKPRYVVVAFPTNRNNVISSDFSLFDHCNISNIKLYLNNERYPYDDMNLNFNESHFHELYYAIQNIQQNYYDGDVSFYNPVGLDIANFMNRPIFAFDCSR